MLPESFGKYAVLQRLGHGGMAEVYEAYDPNLDRRVAIKVIHAHLALDPDFGERFHREARLVASLRHPHIVQVHDFDAAHDQPYMVMEYLDGGTLKDRLSQLQSRGETMPLAEVKRLLEAIASALDYAHAQGAVHRDIKPANILFTANGEPVLTDFGIAKLLGELTQMSATGSVIGTPVYMSPEQAASRPVDKRSDIYSLGVILYELTAGRAPFAGESPTAVMMKHLNEPPPPPRRFNPSLPQAVEGVILRALAKDPAQRYATAGDLARAFTAALSGDAATVVQQESREAGEQGRDLTLWPAAPLLRLRRWFMLGIAAGVILVIALGARFIAPLLSVSGGPGTGSNPAGQPAAQEVRLRFRDGAAPGLSDEVTLIAPALAMPAPSTQYFAWLIGAGDENRRPIGPLTLGDSATRLTYTDPNGSNLLASFDAIEITIEPSPDNDPLPSDDILLQGRLPPQALVHVGHLLVHRDDTPDNGGYALGLLKEGEALQKQADLLRAALEAEDLRGMTNIAEGIVNLIEGQLGEDYGDINGDGQLNDRGDGFGFLPNGDRVGYLQGVRDHAKLAAEQPDATDNIKLHAGHVQVCARNVAQWASSLRDLALDIAQAEDVQSVEGKTREAISLIGRIIAGQDLNGNEEVEPISDEGGVLTAFQHAQFMADIILAAP